MEKLAVLFPGRGYTVDRPLFYYAAIKYRALGYSVLPVLYGDALENNAPLRDAFGAIISAVGRQIRDLDFSSYGDVVFVSKSLGTVVAGRLAEILDAGVRHVILTPLTETLPYIRGDNNIGAVIAGDADDNLDARTLRVRCETEGVVLRQFSRAGHSLTIPNDAVASIEILKEIAETYFR